MLYQKLKTISLKLDDKIKDELSKDKYDIVSSVDVSGRKEVGPFRTSFIGILLSKIRLRKIRIVYFSILSFFVDVAITATEQFLIIFGDSAKSFNLLYRQHGLSVCPIPYATFKQKQRHAKVFSLAGITTIILVSAMSSILINLIVGPIEKTLAATYYWTQSSWAGGTSVTSATHASNQTGWTYYTSKDAGIVAGTDLTIDSTSDSTGDDTTFDTYSSASSSLSVASGAVSVLKADGSACGSGSECESAVCETVCISPIFVFVTPSTYNGNLGGRSGADSKCAAAAPSGAANVHALLSVNASSEIQDLWSLYGYDDTKALYWYNLSTSAVTLMANNKSDLLDGSIQNTQLAGTGVDAYVWTGSNSDGSLYTNSCINWTSSYWSGAQQRERGQYGYPGSVGSSWLISPGSGYGCSTALHVRCLFEFN